VYNPHQYWYWCHEAIEIDLDELNRKVSLLKETWKDTQK
jgi:hypothetical protein